MLWVEINAHILRIDPHVIIFHANSGKKSIHFLYLPNTTIIEHHSWLLLICQILVCLQLEQFCASHHDRTIYLNPFNSFCTNPFKQSLFKLFCSKCASFLNKSLSCPGILLNSAAFLRWRDIADWLGVFCSYSFSVHHSAIIFCVYFSFFRSLWSYLWTIFRFRSRESAFAGVVMSLRTEGLERVGNADIAEAVKSKLDLFKTLGHVLQQGFIFVRRDDS